MTTVKKLLKTKGNDLWTIDPDAFASAALQKMADKNIGALLVTKDDKLVGIFSERDYARKVFLKGKSSAETTVGELMTSHVFYVGLEDRMEECMSIMTERHIRHLPVIEVGRLIGIVTLGDVVKQVITDQKIKIKELEKFIDGYGYGV